MTTLTIRNLPDDLIERLKEAAAHNGRSMEQEVRDLLARRYASRDAVVQRMRHRWPVLPAPTAQQVEQWIDHGRQ